MAIFLFLYGTFSAIFALMFAMSDLLYNGVGCIPDQPTLGWLDWWYEFFFPEHTAVYGAGIVYPKGEIVTNPWVRLIRCTFTILTCI